MDYRNAVEALCKSETFQKEIRDYDRASKRLVMRLSSPETNRERLEQLVHVPFLDLALSFALEVDEMEGVSGLVHVTKSLAEHWGMSPEQLYADARRNALRLDRYMVKDFGTMVKSMVDQPELLPEFIGTTVAGKNLSMYVVTDQSNRNGSMALTVKEVWNWISQILGKNLIILPSSVNELIILADSGEQDYQWLKSVVRDVNDSYVPKNEILSYSVYHYSKVEDRVSIAA